MSLQGSPQVNEASPAASQSEEIQPVKQAEQADSKQQPAASNSGAADASKDAKSEQSQSTNVNQPENSAADCVASSLAPKNDAINADKPAEAAPNASNDQPTQPEAPASDASQQQNNAGSVSSGENASSAPDNASASESGAATDGKEDKPAGIVIKKVDRTPAGPPAPNTKLGPKGVASASEAHSDDAKPADGSDGGDADEKAHETDGKTQAPLPEITNFHSLEDLQKKTSELPDKVDPEHKELYLTDADFSKVFGMDKAAFHGLPKWRQQKMKKEHKLF